ncbi:MULTISPECIES: SDR family oxidoreductase [unclassified Novosphingobium]|uniref:SDR family oxidoreductase n=1 Tax=unclassified Novosphingobium TaxID=2644732 RepID=UPI0013576D0E|nr:MULTISPECIES: SDR family oxidoreductase [unclassified Novosphingobium]
MGRLQGRVAIVTGAARGLGAAAARALAIEGAAVMLTDVLESVAETAAALAQDGFQARHHSHDVTSDQEWQSVVAATISAFGEINVLVNNAGINLPGTIDDIEVDAAQQIMNVNYFGAMRGIKAVLPSMRSAGHGSIVNISSNSTRMIAGLTTAYSPTKAALALLTKNVAVACAQGGDDIRCNSIHPGPHETAMLLGDAMDGNSDAAIKLIQPMIDAIPMGRMGKPMEIGKAVAFLASDDASYITGAEIFVDGGLSLL